MNTLLNRAEIEECCLDCVFSEVCEIDSKAECQRLCVGGIDTSPDYDYVLYDDRRGMFSWQEMYEKRSGLTQRLLDEEQEEIEEVTLIELRKDIYT